MKGLVTERRIGVIAGGVSAERDISLKSGSAVFRALETKGYDVILVDASDGVCERVIEEGVEFAFLALHGGWGEDGSIQGLFEVMGIPYTGSGVLASALAMDKVASKKIFRHHRLRVPPYMVVERGNVAAGIVEPPFGPPWVVKPAREGSSMGVSITDSAEELGRALKEALLYGDRVIVEAFVRGKEVQIGLLGSTVLGGVEVRPVRGFYDYLSKYTPGLTEYVLPPEIDEAVFEEAKDVALRAHEALGCEGATRVDLIVDEAGSSHLLEVNTIPGLTETSLLPKIAARAGYDFTSLVETMILDALGRRGKE